MRARESWSLPCLKICTRRGGTHSSGLPGQPAFYDDPVEHSSSWEQVDLSAYIDSASAISRGSSCAAQRDASQHEDLQCVTRDLRSQTATNVQQRDYISALQWNLQAIAFPEKPQDHPAPHMSVEAFEKDCHNALVELSRRNTQAAQLRDDHAAAIQKVREQAAAQQHQRLADIKVRDNRIRQQAETIRKQADTIREQAEDLSNIKESFLHSRSHQAAPAKQSDGWMQNVFDFFASHENSSQSLQQQVQHLTGKVDELCDINQCLQQQLQIRKEQPPRKVVAHIPIVNYICNTGTCPDGYSLNTIKSFRLKPAVDAMFKWLWQLSQDDPDSGLPQLLECDRGPWSRIRKLWHQESNPRNRKLLLRDAFMHAVLQQLDLLCWQAAEQPAKVFLQKRQIQSIVTQALEAENSQLADNPQLARANELLDLYTKNCQFWLSQCKQDSSITLDDAGSIAVQLIFQLWPNVAAGCATVQVAQEIGLVDVVQKAMLMRLLTESCHPCLRLCMPSCDQSENICTFPAVRVDANFAQLGHNDGFRQQGQFCPLSEYHSV